MRKIIIIFMISIACFIWNWQACYSQGGLSDEVEFVYQDSECWSGMQDIAIKGNYAYCAFYYGMVVLDISDLSAIDTISKIPLMEDRSYGISIQEDYAFVTNCNAGLQVIDISNPYSPFIAANLEDIGDTYRIMTDETYAYITADNKFLIIDISDPLNPHVVESVTLPVYTQSNFDIEGNYAFVANASYGIQILDISNKDSCFIISEYPTDWCEDIDIQGEYAYYTDTNIGLIIVDISDIHNPTFKSAYQNEGYQHSALRVFNQKAYIGLNVSSMLVVDVSTADNPSWDNWIFLDINSERIVINNNYLYAIGVDFGLEILDISAPQNIEEVGRHITGLTRHIEITDSYIFAGGTNPALRILWGMRSLSEEYSNDSIDFIHDICIKDTLLLAACGRDGFNAYDISSPWMPEIINHYPTYYYSESRELTHNGDYIYLYTSGDGNSNIIIFEYEGDGSLDSIGSIALDDYIYDMAAWEEYLYITLQSKQIQVYDIQNPSSPESIDTVSVDQYIYSLSIDSDMLYIMGEDLFLYDIRNPAELVLDTSFDLPWHGGEFIIDGDYAFLTHAGGNHLAVLNVKDRSKTHTAHVYETPGQTWDVALEDNYAVIADYYGIISVEMKFSPIVYNMPDTTFGEGTDSIVFYLDDRVKDQDHSDDQMDWPQPIPIATSGFQADIDNENRIAIIYVPDTNKSGGADTGIFVFTAYDPDLKNDNDTARFIINWTNDPPLFSNPIPDQVINEKDDYNLIQFDNFIDDPDHPKDSIKYDVTGIFNGFGVYVDSLNRTAIVTPPDTNKFSGEDSAIIVFEARDPLDSVGYDTARFIVQWANDPPEARDTTLNTDEEQAVFGLCYATDFDTDAGLLMFSKSSDPDSGTITEYNTATGAFTYEPNENFYGLDSFTFQAYDGNSYSEKGVARIEVAPVNDRPYAEDIAFATTEDASLIDQLIASDVDREDTLRFSVYDSSLNGSVDELDSLTGIFTYIPDENYNGLDSFTYRVSDGQLDSLAKVVLNISAVNDNPIVSPMPDSIISDSIWRMTLDDYVYDVDNADSEIEWTCVVLSDNFDVAIAANRIAEIRVLDRNKARGDIIAFIAADDSAAADTGYVHVGMKAASQTICDSLTPKRYRMISLPIDPDDNSTSAALDELEGRYGYDWRLDRYDPRGDSLIKNMSSLEPGLAYWLISTQDVAIAVSGQSFIPNIYDFNSPIGQQSYYSIVLEPGWNQIGAPFAYSVDFFDCLVGTEASNLVEIGSVGCPVTAMLYHYDGSGYDNSGSVLRPGDGYWIEVDSGIDSCIFWFSAKEYSQSYSNPNNTIFSPGEWEVVIKADCGGYYDYLNRFGVRSFARDTKDDFDFSEPPQMTPYVSLVFDSIYTTDYRLNIDESTAWDFSVRTDIDDLVRLSFESNSFPADDLELALTDLTDNLTIVMIPDKSYSYYSASKERFFKISVHEKRSSSTSSHPIRYRLYNNYPNPFNAATSISFDLIEPRDVTLTISNTLGQVVKTYDQPRLTSGNHTVTWDGTDDAGNHVASGIYLYSIKAGSFTASHKMTLLK